MNGNIRLFIFSNVLAALAYEEVTNESSPVHNPFKPATYEKSSDATNDTLNRNIQEVFGQPSLSNRSNIMGGADGCICVPSHLCKTGRTNVYGMGIVNIRSNNEPCEHDKQVCCSLPNRIAEPATNSYCGYRKPRGAGVRIADEENENESEFGEFPWMVEVLRVVPVEGNLTQLVYECGGALIHEQMVVTAAHCVKDKHEKFVIRAGEWDLRRTDELYPHQDRNVAKVEIHPKYYTGAYHNDIAVLYLETSVQRAPHVNTICLPPQAMTVEAGTTCYATGWGKDAFGKKGKYQSTMKKIGLPIVQNDECQTKLRTTKLGQFFELHMSFICAGGEPRKDTCEGDGGSPLVCPIVGETDRYYQAGIVSWGINCGMNNIPGVYVNVPLFKDWIDSQMEKYQLETSSYHYEQSNSKNRS